MKIATLALAAVAAFGLAGTAQAADLVTKPRVHAQPQAETHLCKVARKVDDIPFSEIVAAVNAYHDDALETKSQTLFSRSMRYNWALETSAWCGAAIGYTKTGIVDDEAVRKCACFHWVMIHQ
jgi:hypothetical protein